MNSKHLIESFELYRAAGAQMALVTVYETLGSTYSKAGTRMIISSAGESQGLVSGGCLEGDLAERARRVIESGKSMTQTYDLRDEADELFGLGVGCNGLIRVLLQPLTEAQDFEPMASIAAALLSDSVGAIAAVIDSQIPGIDCGAALVVSSARQTVIGLPDEAVAALSAECQRISGSGQAVCSDRVAGLKLLLAPLVPVPQVLILGAGPDAIALVNIIAELGWRVSIADHRPAYLARAGLDRAESKIAVTPGRLAAAIGLNRFSAIIVMSHHLATDREFLRELAHIDVPYLGLLGPPARKTRLIADLGAAGEALNAKLRGPVGIDIGADTAESIAVSIAAEMQQVLVKAV